MKAKPKTPKNETPKVAKAEAGPPEGEDLTIPQGTVIGGQILTEVAAKDAQRKQAERAKKIQTARPVEPPQE